MAPSRSLKIAVVPGDGISTAVMSHGVGCLKALAAAFNLELEFEEVDFASCAYYKQQGDMLPADWRATLGRFDAIYFGAIGMPDQVPDHVSLRGSLVKSRRELTSATKSNGISITMPYWDERVVEIAKGYPEVSFDKYHIDTLTAHLYSAEKTMDSLRSLSSPTATVVRDGAAQVVPSNQIVPGDIVEQASSSIGRSASSLVGCGFSDRSSIDQGYFWMIWAGRRSTTNCDTRPTILWSRYCSRRDRRV
ncbi:hypothetical protein PG987_004919 [Apiospora arundinis]